MAEDTVYIGTVHYSDLEQYDLDTGIATGVTKSNSSSDPDYVAPHLDPDICKTKKWVGDTFECEQV